MQAEYVADLGPARILHPNALRVRHRAAHLLPDHIRLVQDADRVPERLAHLHLAVEPHDAAHLGNDRLWFREEFPEACVPPSGDRARELQVLALVLSHGHRPGEVDEDVRRLQHRIVQESHRHRLQPGRLVLVLGHALQVAHGRDRVEEPRQLHVLDHVRLYEDRAALGIQTHREQAHRHVEGALGQLGRIELAHDRVLVHDREEAVVLVLHPDPLAKRAQVVAQMGLSAGLNAAQHPHLLFGSDLAHANAQSATSWSDLLEPGRRAVSLLRPSGKEKA